MGHVGDMMQNEKRILISIGLVAAILSSKLTVAFYTNSLALFSDSWHLFTDLASLAISWWGLRIAKKPADSYHTYGYYRYSVLTALINNLSLIVVSIFILCKAIERYLHPVQVEPKGMILIALIGLFVNSLIVLNLKSNTKNLNIKSAFIHFVGDALADVGVLLGGILIYLTGWIGIDTILSAILACLILKSAVQMTLECLRIFLESTPKHLSIETIREAMIHFDGVLGVTDIHIWSVSHEVLALTAHVQVNNYYLISNEELLHQLQHLLYVRFDIEHSTLQIEQGLCSSCYHRRPGYTAKCSLCIDLCPDQFQA